MNDKELADAVVALGVLHEDQGIYSFDPFPCHPYASMTAKQVVRDWRVAGALIEKCDTVQFTRTTTKGSYVVARKGDSRGYAEQPKGNDSRAIIEACVDEMHDL